MNKRLHTLRSTFILLALALLVGCAGNDQAKTLDLTLSQYEKHIRWSQWDATTDFLAPEYLAKNDITPLDMDRLRLFRVTQYNIRSSAPYDNGLGFRQVVEIRLFNRNRAVERVIIDRQDWRYDATAERWLLHSGLPDVTRAR